MIMRKHGIEMDKEQRLIKQIKKNGNRSAANELVRSYYKEMYAFIYKQTIDGDLSLDLTQELFIHILNSIHNFDGKRASFRTWLYKVASNRLVDYFRSKSYRHGQLTAPLEDYDPIGDEDITVSLEYKEEIEKVTTLVNELDTKLQQVVRLKLFGEYTFQEIAEIEMITESTVKTRYYTALKRIRSAMKEENDR